MKPMRKRPSSSVPKPATGPAVVTRKAALWMMAGAFAAGVGTSWLIFHESRAPGAGSVGTAGVGAPDNTPPDVSMLEPAQAALTLGNWHYDHRNWSQAMEHYQRAISLGLDNADVRTDFGNCFRFSGDPQKALEQYRIAQNRDPQHEHSLFNMATLYAEVLKDPAKASETWREYLRRFPNSTHAAEIRQLLGDEKSNANGSERTQLMDWLQKQEASK